MKIQKWKKHNGSGQRAFSSSSFEYSPKGVQLKKGELGTNVIDISKSEIASQKLTFNSSQLQITNLMEKPHKVTFQANASAQSQVTLNTFSFPNWRVEINGKSVPIDNNNKFKLISFDIPKGTNDDKKEFTNTPLKKSANIISGISAIAIIN